MGNLFSHVINMTMTGSVAILMVMVVRLLLKRSPKIFSYALWAVVLFRLLCPVSLTSAISVLDIIQPETRELSENVAVVSYLPATPAIRADFVEVREENASVPDKPDTKLIMTPMHAAGLVWAAGVAVMGLYSVVQYGNLRRKLVGNVPLRDNIYLADHLSTAFVLGIMRPRIYLPSGLPAEEREYILAHERHHIHRLDHIAKLLAYVALCIHWFNPLVWAAFILSGRDMEMSCDEAVIRRLGEDIRADYSAALLRLATHKKIISGMPLAFGEGDTKGRVLNMAKWKKPKIWVSGVCILLCIAVLAACGLNPEDSHTSDLDGRVTMVLPEGYTYEESSDGNLLFTDGNTIIGGRTLYTAPEEFSMSQYFSSEFIAALGIPEALDDTLGHSGGGNQNGIGPAGWSEEFFSDVPPGTPRKVHSYHQFYVLEDNVTIVDIWFDLLTVDNSVKDSILSSVEIPEIGRFTQQYLPEESITSMPFEIMQLPEGYYYMPDGNGNIDFLDDGTNIVGGIMAYPIPKGVYDAADKTFFWLENVGIPDFEDASLCYMGGITCGDYGWQAEFASDVPPGEEVTVRRSHHFYPIEGVVYDIWFDMLRIDLNTSSDIFYSVKLPNVAQQVVAETNSAEDRAFEMSRAIMNAVAEGGCTILQTETSATNEGPMGYERMYHFYDGSLLYTSTVLTDGENVNEAGEYYNRYALLYTEDNFYDNHGTQGQPGDIQWVSAQEPETIPVPWLASRIWNKTYVTYIDTLSDGNGDCLIFRYDAKYEDQEDYADVYWVNFYFDPMGNFKYVQLDVNLFLDNAFTVTESIVSLDPEAVSAEIDREYKRAIG